MVEASGGKTRDRDVGTHATRFASRRACLTASASGLTPIPIPIVPHASTASAVIIILGEIFRKARKNDFFGVRCKKTLEAPGWSGMSTCGHMQKTRCY